MSTEPVPADDLSAARRDRILNAALQAIVAEGVAGLTLRDVAHRARVSLGSISYYFDDKDGLLAAAFMSFVNSSVKKFTTYYASVTSLDEARRATVTMLTMTASSRTTIILGSELYNLSLRRPRHRMIVLDWTNHCRAVMGRFFDSDTTFIIDAFYQGVLLHRNMGLGDYPDARIKIAVERMTPPHAYIGPGSEPFQLKHG